MIFSYQPVIVAAADGDFLELLRPEIEVSIEGVLGRATVVGLVDTGSDNTIFPKSVADVLGIRLSPSSAPPALTFGGLSIPLSAGVVTLQLESDDASVRWQTTINFYEFESPELEAVILGHTGFLEYFTATFDGQKCTLTLVPNNDMPQVE
jgi:hypothetical protein